MHTHITQPSLILRVAQQVLVGPHTACIGRACITRQGCSNSSSSSLVAHTSAAGDVDDDAAECEELQQHGGVGCPDGVAGDVSEVCVCVCVCVWLCVQRQGGSRSVGVGVGVGVCASVGMGVGMGVGVGALEIGPYSSFASTVLVQDDVQRQDIWR